MVSGIVYFVACKDPEYRIKNPHMKIGWTADLKERMHALQTGSPVELAIMGYIETEDPKVLERYFHSLFKKDKRHGEWFDVTDAMLTRICCYPVLENRLHEFFLPPSKKETREILVLRDEIDRLKLVISEKNKIIKDFGIVRPEKESRHHATAKRSMQRFARDCIYQA